MTLEDRLEEQRRREQGELLERCERVARENYGGHFTLLRFTCGWVCCFGTPTPFREEVLELSQRVGHFDTAADAMRHTLALEREQ